jgi:hypothetical protein
LRHRPRVCAHSMRAGDGRTREGRMDGGRRRPAHHGGGRVGPYVVAMGAGLVGQYYADRPTFLAIVRHELAHLRNRDVTQTYLAIAIWRAFLLVALLPFAVNLVTQPVEVVAGVAWRVAAMAALVVLTRNAVLRARELSADVRASTWDGPSGALRRLLTPQPGPKPARWRALLSVHPDLATRRRTLDDPLAGCCGRSHGRHSVPAWPPRSRCRAWRRCSPWSRPARGSAHMLRQGRRCCSRR